MADPNSNEDFSVPDSGSMEPVQSGHVSAPIPANEADEVLLRSRDVQALSRTFRRLAEIQDGLADQIRGFEEERKYRWVLPAIAIGCLVLGVGLGLFGLVWYQKQQPNQPLEVNWDSLPPQTIEVKSPEGGLDAELVQAMLLQLEKMGQAQTQDRRVLSEIGSKLVDNEMSALSLMKELTAMEASQPVEAVASASPQDAEPIALDPEQAASETDPERLGYPPNPWLGALNGLIAVDGYPHFRFQEATRVAGESSLANVVFFIWNDEGLLQSIVRAETVEFILQKSTFSMQLHFQNGTRTGSGVKSAFPEGGLNVFLPDITVPVWLAHFPEITPESYALSQMELMSQNAPVWVDPAAAQGGGSEAKEPVKPAFDVETLRIAIDELLSVKRNFGHYRLERLESVEGDALKMVRLAWYNGQGELFKYIEADTLQIRARGEGWVELNFENGCFIRLNKKTPFRNSIYRIQLSDQNMDAWTASAAPMID